MLLQRRSEKIDFIRKVPLFSACNKRELDMVAKCADEISVPAKHLLVREGGIARELIIIVEGTTRVERSGKLVAHPGPGEVIGEMSLIDGKPRSATVSTESPCTLLVIEGRSFWPLVESVPGFCRKLLVALSERVRAIETQYLD